MKKSEKEVIAGGKVSPTATPVAYSEVEKLIVSVRGQPVIVDADVAKLYGVATKRVNEAVRNNPEKFPSDYMFALTADELSDLRSKISSAKISSKSRVLPKAFTEKGLYMLATILKSQRATEATFAIIETFAKVRRDVRQGAHAEARARGAAQRTEGAGAGREDAPFWRNIV